MKGEGVNLLVDLLPTLNYGIELWAVTERTRSQIHAAEMSFLLGSPLEMGRGAQSFGWDSKKMSGLMDEWDRYGVK